MLADEEDVLLLSFIEPLTMESFLRNMEGTIVHGNGYPLVESIKRKIKVSRKYMLPTRGIKGRAPDRTIEFKVENNPFSVFVLVKIKKNASKNEDFVKLASLMKDILDEALIKGLISYFVAGMSIEGLLCKLYSINMPVKKCI